MSEFRKSSYWSRLAIEGAVIVFSILLAFAIDAWWEERKERAAEFQKLALVSAELITNAEIIQGKLELLEAAVEATSQFVSWMGPDSESIQPQVLTKTWMQLYSIGTFSMMKGATENFLASGHIDRTHNADVRHAVDEWYSLSGDLERQYALLRDAHANIGRYLVDSIPMLHLDSANPVMANHPTSKFPFAQSDILSDPQLESRFSIYLIRQEFVIWQAQDLLERQPKLLDLLDMAQNNK